MVCWFSLSPNKGIGNWLICTFTVLQARHTINCHATCIYCHTYTVLFCTLFPCDELKCINTHRSANLQVHWPENCVQYMSECSKDTTSQSPRQDCFVPAGSSPPSAYGVQTHDWQPKTLPRLAQLEPCLSFYQQLTRAASRLQVKTEEKVPSHTM